MGSSPTLATNEERKMNDFGYHMEADDIVIRRVRNGWVVFTPHLEPDDYKRLSVDVYEDLEGSEPFSPNAMSNSAPSFKRLLWEHLGWLFRSKRGGGMQIEIHKKGYESES